MAPSAVNDPLPTGAPTAGGDEFDDLFDYEVDGENDPFSESYKVLGAKETSKENASGKDSNTLGIDEEIEVTRKPRAPRVKLDEHRLLSANGIPKLRKKAKSELRLKGKGHEYSDAARLLAFYQLWLDDLFPKARFLDALSMVEKMGHKKMLQTARMEWIDEGKPKSVDADEMLYDEPTLPPRENGNQEPNVNRIAPIFDNRPRERFGTSNPNANVEEDLYNATPTAVRRRSSPGDVPDSQDSLFGGTTQSIFGPRKSTTGDDSGLGDDDLDALLAEEDASRTTNNTSRDLPAPSKAVVPDDFEAEMEAMAEMDGMW